MPWSSHHLTCFICDVMLHERLFTCSFEASGVAVSFLAVLVGVTCATRGGKLTDFNNFYSCHTKKQKKNKCSNVKSICITFSHMAGNESAVKNVQN